MDKFMYGRLTTLNHLKARRDDYSRPPMARLQADRAIRKIVSQLRDKQLMRLRERLIKAVLYGDEPATWLIENQIRTYEKNFDAVERQRYTKRDEDE